MRLAGDLRLKSNFRENRVKSDMLDFIKSERRLIVSWSIPRGFIFGIPNLVSNLPKIPFIPVHAVPGGICGGTVGARLRLAHPAGQQQRDQQPECHRSMPLAIPEGKRHRGRIMRGIMQRNMTSKRNRFGDDERPDRGAFARGALYAEENDA